MVRQLSLPGLTGLAHGASDAAAGFLAARILIANSTSGAEYILLYNMLAFGLQPVAGLILDRFNIARRGTAVGLLLSATSLLCGIFNLSLGVLLAGLGSALLHAGGGAVALTSTPGCAIGPGIFAAFGVIGLALGSQVGFYFPNATIIVLSLTFGILAGAIWFVPLSSLPTTQPPVSKINIEALAMAFILAVALRSFVWTGLQTNLPDYGQLVLPIALAAGCGKLLGGMLADRVGWRNYTLIGLALSSIFLTWQHVTVWLLLAGVFFLQSITPLSMAAMHRLLPSSPALATSLVLGTGILLGGMFLSIGSSVLFNGSIGTSAVLLVSAAIYFFALKQAQTDARDD